MMLTIYHLWNEKKNYKFQRLSNFKFHFSRAFKACILVSKLKKKDKVCKRTKWLIRPKLIPVSVA